MTHEPQKT